jgi:hypothetical protein
MVRQLRHHFRSIASRQNASAIVQLYQSARVLDNPAAIDRPSNRQIVMPVDDLFLADRRLL